MKNWWDSLAARERRLVTAGAALVVVTLLWTLAIVPVLDHRRSLADGVAAQRTLLAWMRSIEPAGGTAGRPADGESLFALVDRSVRATPLAGSVQRLQPEAGNGVRIWLEGASFDELVRWIAVLERDHGIAATAMSVERGQGAGSVNARLTLQVS